MYFDCSFFLQKNLLWNEEFIQWLRNIFQDFIPLPTKSHYNFYYNPLYPLPNKVSLKLFETQDFITCTHAFVRRDSIQQSLQPHYNWLFEVIKCNDKIFKAIIKGKNVNIVLQPSIVANYAHILTRLLQPLKSASNFWHCVTISDHTVWQKCQIFR